MKTTWNFPQKERHLENDMIHLSAVNLEKDLDPLFEAASFETNQEDLFKYMMNIPTMDSIHVFENFLKKRLAHENEISYKVFSKRLNKIVGSASLINIQKDHGTLEIGTVWYTKAAQKTEINTNTIFLLLCYIFETLEYRRVEWKCNNKNEGSKKAALRLGFEYEGLFRQHVISRGENRDTAWFSMIDKEWAEKKQALQNRLT